MGITIKEVDKVEILTLQDNYIDLVSRDNTEIVLRAMPLKGKEMKNSILAEHGFSSIVTVTRGKKTRSILFDFGFSAFGAAFNAETLGVNLGDIEAAALSHGHLDHVGGLAELMKSAAKEEIDLVVHPEVFRDPRYLMVRDDLKIKLPSFTRKTVEEAGMHLVETEGPYPLLDGEILFLGGIPRLTDFEKGSPKMIYQVNGEEKWDDVADDTSLVMDVKGKGLVILSGCAHSGIINTVKYAKRISGVHKVFAIMGGFHLTGPEMEPVIEPTIRELKKIDPSFIVPTHCTGRDAVMQVEKEMPDRFILNMVGTTLTFSS